MPKDAEAVSKGGRPWWLEPAIAVGGTLAGSVLQYKLASKGANTAHQREVQDLSKAGLNPILSVMGGRGAAAPEVPDFGESISKSAANALALSQMRANLDLTRASAAKIAAETTGLGIENATRAGTQEADISFGRMRGRLAELDVQQREAVMETAIKRAKAELAQSEASAKSLRARAELDRLAAVGAKNVADLEKRLGEGSPAALLVLKYLNVLLLAR